MIRYYCNACGNQVQSLGDLIDLLSRRSDDVRREHAAFFSGPYSQGHVCGRCVEAIKRFVATLSDRPATPTGSAEAVDQTARRSHRRSMLQREDSEGDEHKG